MFCKCKSDGTLDVTMSQAGQSLVFIAALLLDLSNIQQTWRDLT